MKTSDQNQVVFHTNGIIDPLSWEVIGMSAKETDNPIGQFGSGLKFALAVLLRNEHEVEIHTPDTTYIFSTKTTYFRGKEFQIIQCNGKDLGITTAMGKNWELWMAYRELVCNTMDEGGLHFSGDKLDEGTSIIVKGEDFHELLSRHEEFFVGDRDPIESVPGRLNVYAGNGRIFYRGVRIGLLEKASFDYELLDNVTLTEDRTYASLYEVTRSITRAVCFSTNKNFILRLLAADPKNSFESKLEYQYFAWSSEFEDACLTQWKHSPSKTFRNILTKLRENRPDLCLEIKDMTKEQSTFIETVLAHVSQMGYPVHKNIQLAFGEATSRSIFSMGNQICVTEAFFHEGMFNAVLRLFRINIEENHPFDQTEYLAVEMVKLLAQKHKIQL